jgi:hypothetical protein
MAKKRKRSKSGDYERFVALPHYMLKAPVWKTLPPDAKALLIEVWMRHNGMNNGEISYSVREAQAIGLSRSTAGRMFIILEERGFLEITRNATFSLKTKEARLWRLTMEPCNGERASRAFMRWTRESATSKPSKSRTQSHRGDAQSRAGNYEPNDATKLSTSVSSQGPSVVNPTDSQSLPRDTYIIPGGTAGICGVSSPPEKSNEASKPNDTIRSGSEPPAGQQLELPDI